MTPERALEIIKDELTVESGIINEAFKIIENAVEKQMPKKPLVIKYDEDVKLGAVTWRAGVPVYQCSHCNSFISRSNDFCSKCGQALNWSDKDEL